MKHTKQFGLSFTAILVLIAFGVSAYADMNAGEIVGNFNSMNGGLGFRFESVISNPLVTATTQVGSTNVDISAYAAGRAGTTSGRTYFTTFCVQPDHIAVSPGVGKLSFNTTNGQTVNSSGIALSLGAATLYKQYATGEITIANVELFRTALRVLNGNEVLSNWSTNMYLAGLAGNRDYWTQKYDARQRYDEIGDYCVFVMQVTTPAGAPGQDFLYIANATFTTTGVPEPATMLLWAIGGIGFAGASRIRRARRFFMKNFG